MSSVEWEHLHLAVVGGDEREQEIARLAGATGARVTTFGFPWPADGIENVERMPTAADALDGARYGLLPIPVPARPGLLYAPVLAGEVALDDALLGRMAPDAQLFVGRSDEPLRAAAARCSVGVEDYDDDRELMLLRGPAIVEGALASAIANTRMTLNHSPILVVGFGNIGGLLTGSLLGLGGRVTVAARNPIQRANAHAMGAESLALDELPSHAERFPIVFSVTAAGPVVTAPLLELLPPQAVVLDLAPPPGSVDLEAARALGHTAIWARGLGSRAPVTVGASQWHGLRRRIEQIEASRPSRPTPIALRVP